jgi:hypothetical protein
VLHQGPTAAGRRTVTWDLRDARGARVPPGIYHCELRAAGARLAWRLAVLN